MLRVHAPLDYKIYVEPPESFQGKNGNYVWKLQKSLYGLKQSCQTWNKTFHAYLTTQNFKQAPVNPFMDIQNVNSQIPIILLWADDILIASKNEADLMKIKAKLNSRFKMTDLGKLSCFLGIQFEYKNSTIKMNQSRYIEKILSKFGMADCKPHSTPCEMDITKTSSLSTCEAEFITISLASQEGLYLRALLRIVTELESRKHPKSIHFDNQSSIILTKTSYPSKIETY